VWKTSPAQQANPFWLGGSRRLNVRDRHTIRYRVIQVRWLTIQITICQERPAVKRGRRNIEHCIIRAASLIFLALMLLKGLLTEMKTLWTPFR
jgi:hypothetical protein